MSTSRNFKSLEAVAPSDADIEAFAQRRGVPALRPVPEAAKQDMPDAKPADAEIAPTTRLALEIPLYLSDQLKRRALDDRCSTRYVILKAIRAAGFEINETDLIADGRRDRR